MCFSLRTHTHRHTRVMDPNTNQSYWFCFYRLNYSLCLRKVCLFLRLHLSKCCYTLLCMFGFYIQDEISSWDIPISWFRGQKCFDVQAAKSNKSLSNWINILGKNDLSSQLCLYFCRLCLIFNIFLNVESPGFTPFTSASSAPSVVWLWITADLPTDARVSKALWRRYLLLLPHKQLRCLSAFVSSARACPHEQLTSLWKGPSII